MQASWTTVRAWYVSETGCPSVSNRKPHQTILNKWSIVFSDTVKSRFRCFLELVQWFIAVRPEASVMLLDFLDGCLWGLLLLLPSHLFLQDEEERGRDCTFRAGKQHLPKDPQQISISASLCRIITRGHAYLQGKWEIHFFRLGPLLSRIKLEFSEEGRRGELATGRLFAVSVIRSSSLPTFTLAQSIFHTSSDIIQSMFFPLKSLE